MLNMKNTKKSLIKSWMTTELKQNLPTNTSKKRNLLTNQIAKILEASKMNDPLVPVNIEKEVSLPENVAGLKIDVNIKRTDVREAGLKREVLVEKVKRSRNVHLVIVIAVRKKEDIDVGLSTINAF